MRLFVLLIAHMLADFTLQTNGMANRKKAETKFLLLHCAIYTVVMAVGCFLCMSIESACGMIAWFGATHLLIDWVRTKFENKKTREKTHKTIGEIPNQKGRYSPPER